MGQILIITTIIQCFKKFSLNFMRGMLKKFNLNTKSCSNLFENNTKIQIQIRFLIKVINLIQCGRK
jgi:hypothetical protein